MRSSISCEACRTSKVKCVHTGSPPCRRCLKSGIAGCVLSRPKVRSAKARDARRSTYSTTASHASPIDETPPRQSRPSHSIPAYQDIAATEEHLASLTNGTILKSLNVFNNKFPELAILHLPTLMSAWQDNPSLETKVLVAVVLAVTKAQLCALNLFWANDLLPKESYAAYARSALSTLVLEPPNIQVAQALLLFTLYEWGTREFHRAWIYCGIAVRIVQALHSMRVAPCVLEKTWKADTDPIAAAIETRTYWACSIMDNMIHSGTYNPPMLPLSEMERLNIPRPVSAVEYAFGTDGSVPSALYDSREPTQPGAPHDITQSFETLVHGFDIWRQVTTFLFNDGRRAPGMCAPENCPWMPTSPWSAARSRLEAWRRNQHRNMHYPATSVAVHMTLCYGETFTCLNLLYYLCTIMLHREYFPWLPNNNSVPRAPVDPPHLEAEAPPNWWEDSAAELFGAAENLTLLLNEASECGVHLMTPFAGFGMFSAGFCNIYVSRFPKMNLGRSRRATELTKICSQYLQDFRQVWSIADSWVKTLKYADLLYERLAANANRYRGRTRYDYDILHHSVHEFRGVDRSEQQDREINGVEASIDLLPSLGTSDDAPGTDLLLNQLMTEISGNLDEQGVWSHWWPPMVEMDTSMNGGLSLGVNGPSDGQQDPQTVESQATSQSGMG